MHAQILQINGVAQMVINGEIVSPVSYRSYEPSAERIRAFAQNGVRVMIVYLSGLSWETRFEDHWLGEGRYDWEPVRKQMDLFVENAPDCYLALMVQLDTRPWFLKDHPECPDSWHRISSVAGWDVWRQSAWRMLRDVIDFVTARYPEKIFSVDISAGCCQEWFNDEYADQDKDALKASMFAAWSGDPGRKIPPDIYASSHGVFRHPEKEKDVIDYWRFNSEIIAETICWFAGRVKEHTGRHLLVRTFFGYLYAFVYNNCDFGHLALERVARCADVDVLFSPASYRLRGLADVSSSQAPIDAIVGAGKMYIHELDQAPYCANSIPWAQQVQYNGMHPTHESMEESIQYYKRECAFSTAKLGHYWWFEMHGGWYDDPRMMQTLKTAREWTSAIFAQPVERISQVAWVADPFSNCYMTDRSLVTDEALGRQRTEIGKTGCPIDQLAAFNLLDEAFPVGRYKLFIFANLFAPDERMRAMVKKLRAMGKSMLFVYAAGAIGPDGFSCEAMRELTNIEVRETDQAPSIVIVPAGDMNDRPYDKIYGVNFTRVRPALTAADADAQAYGRDSRSGAPKLVVKTRADGSFDAWTACARVPAHVLRGLCRKAGVHLFNADNLPLEANSRMLSIFAHRKGTYEIRVPWLKGALIEGFTGETHQVEQGRPYALTFADDECKWFLYKPSP